MSAPRPQPQIAVAYHLALERNFTAHQTMALIALAEMARHNGVTTASLPMIAQKARQSEREAHRSVHFLAAKKQKLVEIISRPGQMTEYKICFGSYSGGGEQDEPLPGSQGLAPEPLPGSQGSEPPPLPIGQDHPCHTGKGQGGNPCHGGKGTPDSESRPLYSLLSLRKEEEGSKCLATLTSSQARALDQAFDTFWEIYPRKRKKVDARKAFAQQAQAGTPVEVIIAGLRQHKFNRDVNFDPYPATWLRARQWEDEPEPQPRNAYDRYLNPSGLSGADDWDGTTINGEVFDAARTH